MSTSNAWAQVESPHNSELEHRYRDQVLEAIRRMQHSGSESWHGPERARALAAVVAELALDNALSWAMACASQEPTPQKAGEVYKDEAWQMAAALQKLFAKMLERRMNTYFMVAEAEAKKGTKKR